MVGPVPSEGLPLNGIRALCITTVWAGPYASQLLADWGCEVIRVESTQRRQLQTRGFWLRFSKGVPVEEGAPWPWAYPDGEPGKRPWNRFSWFNSCSRNKLSMTVDLTQPKGMDILAGLVKISDLFIENNTPSTMDKLGITYDWLKGLNPDIIMIRMPAFGLVGPYRNYRSFGAGPESMSGYTWLRGYPDLDKSEATTTIAHCDAVGGVSAALAAIMALHYRRATGKGLLIEVPLLESILPQMGEAIMDYTMNQRIQESIGNRDIHGAAPSGNYRCKGDDRWVSITVRNDLEWEGFRQALGCPEWTNDDKYSTSLSRYKNQDELDKRVEEWTLNHDMYEIMRLLQNKGIAAAPLLNGADDFSDPHFKESGVLEKITHPEAGTYVYPGIAWTQTNTPNHVRRYAPRLGEDNEYVYKGLLGISDEEYAELEREGHIGVDFEQHVGP